MANKYSKYKNCKHVIACYNIIVAVDGDCPCKNKNGIVHKSACEECKCHEVREGGYDNARL